LALVDDSQPPSVFAPFSTKPPDPTHTHGHTNSDMDISFNFNDKRMNQMNLKILPTKSFSVLVITEIPSVSQELPRVSQIFEPASLSINGILLVNFFHHLFL
jgi:hypothetical protein